MLSGILTILGCPYRSGTYLVSLSVFSKEKFAIALLFTSLARIVSPFTISHIITVTFTFPGGIFLSRSTEKYISMLGVGRGHRIEASEMFLSGQHQF